MEPQTRQTYIAIVGLTAVEIAALSEGMNGRVLTAYFIAVLAVSAPETLDKVLPWLQK